MTKLKTGILILVVGMIMIVLEMGLVSAYYSGQHGEQTWACKNVEEQKSCFLWIFCSTYDVGTDCQGIAEMSPYECTHQSDMCSSLAAHADSLTGISPIPNSVWCGRTFDANLFVDDNCH